MSIVIKFFVAPDAEAAAAVAEGGPDGVFESLTFGNFDVEEALIEWEGIFTGRSFEEVLDDDVPETVVDPDDGEGPRFPCAGRRGRTCRPPERFHRGLSQTSPLRCCGHARRSMMTSRRAAGSAAR